MSFSKNMFLQNGYLSKVSVPVLTIIFLYQMKVGPITKKYCFYTYTFYIHFLMRIVKECRTRQTKLLCLFDRNALKMFFLTIYTKSMTGNHAEISLGFRNSTSIISTFIELLEQTKLIKYSACDWHLQYFTSLPKSCPKSRKPIYPFNSHNA